MSKKLVWVRADGRGLWEARKKLVTTALESGADAVLVNAGEEEKVRTLGRITVVSAGSRADAVVGKDVFMKTVGSKEDEREVVREGGRKSFVVVSASDWKIIPLENIIAGLQGRMAKIIVEVAGEEEAKTALSTLEVGADGVLVDGSPAVVKKVANAVEASGTEKIPLTPAKITKVASVGMGDRVCVDTASMFSVGEGMLVGSASNAMFLVHSESIETEYVAARPFRVNAGAVHAYTLLPGGKTTYLSELSAGGEILAVDYRGNTRRLVLGRSKIEKRPLLLVEADAGGRGVSTLLQNAETILLTRKDGRPVSVAKLKAGDVVLAHLSEGGRHFGMKVKESIQEK
jgi:3-dehydroquinate synthase II